MDDTKKLIDFFNVMDSSKCMIEDKLLNVQVWINLTCYVSIIFMQDR